MDLLRKCPKHFLLKILGFINNCQDDFRHELVGILISYLFWNEKCSFEIVMFHLVINIVLI